MAGDLHEGTHVLERRRRIHEHGGPPVVAMQAFVTAEGTVDGQRVAAATLPAIAGEKPLDRRTAGAHRAAAHGKATPARRRPCSPKPARAAVRAASAAPKPRTKS